ncbi:Positive regulator of CheA protein activity (CheW) [Chitinispirillum alkaliphilum]|nr:Positive regulator of CheA protein activity (CheW) [Chitinispirillum alkaliphilum]
MAQADGNRVDMTSISGKYLTFSLADEGYGIEILKVQEIIGIMNVTNVPRTPDFIRGVINLRGKVIPVVDLRVKFGLEKKDDTEKSCIIVVQVEESEDRTVVMGVIVDEVCEVLDIGADQIEPSPSFGASVNTDFIMGMGKTAQKVVMLLDVDKVLSKNEIISIAKTTEC